MATAFQYRTAHGVWINDMRNTPFINQDWPCVILDQQSIEDIKSNIQLQAENGFTGLAIFGLLTASGWLPQISKTVDRDRKTKVKEILKFAYDHRLKILCGLGVYSWGYDKLIEYDPAVRGTNPRTMCASKEASQKWMEKVIDYLLEEYDFNGFHLEAADLGRCECFQCKPKSNSEYYCDINAKTASYIKSKNPKSELMVSLCGYLPKGKTVPNEDWVHFQKLSQHIDYLIDPGHFGTVIPHKEQKKFLSQLKCAFGNGGGVWLYPPQRWNRLRYFIPYTNRAGKHIENLYEIGGRAMEYNVGPAINPAVEVNIAFGGKKLANVTRNNREILLEVIDQLYQPKKSATAEKITNIFEEAEEAFFRAMDEVYKNNETPLGEIHLTYLFGTEEGPCVYLKDTQVPTEHEWYLVKTMTQMERQKYTRTLRQLDKEVDLLTSKVVQKDRLERIQTCIRNVLTDLT